MKHISTSSKCTLSRDSTGKLTISHAPPIFICVRESIQELLDLHNDLLTQIQLQKQEAIRLLTLAEPYMRHDLNCQARATHGHHCTCGQEKSWLAVKSYMDHAHPPTHTS